jgi:hypothetical protein
MAKAKHSKAHPGFKGAEKSAMTDARKAHPNWSQQHLEKYVGGGIANTSRGASTAAKKANPRLKRVKG